MNQLELTNEQYKQKYLKYKKKYLDLKVELEGGVPAPDVYNAMVKYVNTLSKDKSKLEYDKKEYTLIEIDEEDYRDERITCDYHQNPTQSSCSYPCEFNERDGSCKYKVTRKKKIYSYKNINDVIKLIHLPSTVQTYTTRDGYTYKGSGNDGFFEVEINNEKYRIANDFTSPFEFFLSKRGNFKFLHNGKYYPIRASIGNSIYSLFKD